MEDFKRNVQIRWSDLDPNFHVRHSVYYDWGAFCRIEFLNKYGLTSVVMQQLHIGPVLFREESLFKKEIRYGDNIYLDIKAIKAREDYARWTIQHHINREDGALCAILTVDGAWMDVLKRKLTVPPEQVRQVFDQMPRGDRFEHLS